MTVSVMTTVTLVNPPPGQPNIPLKVPDKKVQTLNPRLLWAGVVLEVVVGIIVQCGSISDAKWPGERDKCGDNPKVTAAESQACRNEQSLLTPVSDSREFYAPWVAGPVVIGLPE